MQGLHTSLHGFFLRSCRKYAETADRKPLPRKGLPNSFIVSILSILSFAVQKTRWGVTALGGANFLTIYGYWVLLAKAERGRRGRWPKGKKVIG